MVLVEMTKVLLAWSMEILVMLLLIMFSEQSENMPVFGVKTFDH